MYKIVAIDLDETLLDDDKQLCERNKIAISKAQELGVKFVPSSGRTPGFLGTTLEDLNINKKEEYSILGNGSIVVDNEKNEVIFCAPIPFEIIEELFEFGKGKDVGIQIFTPDHVYFYYTNEAEWLRIQDLGKNLVRRFDDSIEDLRDKTIIKALYQKKDMPYLKKLAEDLKPLTEGRITVSFSSDRYLELNKLGIDKGEGLRQLAKHLNVDIKDTIGIGDNYNDLELVKSAGLGACVANAIEEIKSVSDYICISDNNEGGVAEVIEKFILEGEK